MLLLSWTPMIRSVRFGILGAWDKLQPREAVTATITRRREGLSDKQDARNPKPQTA